MGSVGAISDTPKGLDFFLDIIFEQGYESHHGYRHKTHLSDGSQELVVAQLQQGGAPVCVEIV
ncbi:MAG: hypothetical protein K9N21_14930 [Deltaproteobacteria bacterium]|nr:hypothetical protein [Deltaproteobacteria bacterium]